MTGEVKASAAGCACGGASIRTHRVQVLFRSTGGAVTWDAVPADKAHELIDRVASSPWVRPDGTVTPREPVTIERAAVEVPRGTCAGDMKTLPAACIVIDPDEVAAVQVT